MTIKAAEFDRIVLKLGLRTRKSGDRLAWLEHEGRVVVRTKRSETRGQDLPFQHSIRQQLKLNQDQLNQLIACTLDRDGYIALLRDKGLL